MADIAILGSTCTGHGCWPPRANSQGEALHIINGKPVHCQGHAWLPHTCPSIPETHAGVTASGNPNHIINGKPVARVGDAVSCGSTIATGEWTHQINE